MPAEPATFGPLTLTVTAQGEPGETPRSFGRVQKLTARWALEVDGDTITSNAPFYYGSAADPHETSAADVMQAVLSDLQSISPYIGYGAGQLAEWAEWADDLGYFAGGTSAAEIRESITGYQTIRAWHSLISERIGADVLETLLAVAHECEDDAPELNGSELHDAGHIGIATARAEGDAFHGRRWEDSTGNVYSAADILAARLEN